MASVMGFCTECFLSGFIGVYTGFELASFTYVCSVCICSDFIGVCKGCCLNGGYCMGFV